MSRTQTAYIVNPPSCCNGYGYVVVVDGWDDEPYAREACWCPAGKQWAAQQGAA